MTTLSSGSNGSSEKRSGVLCVIISLALLPNVVQQFSSCGPWTAVGIHRALVTNASSQAPVQTRVGASTLFQQAPRPQVILTQVQFSGALAPQEGV